MRNAALPHLLTAAEDSLRRVADIVNISSIAGRQAWANYGAYATELGSHNSDAFKEMISSSKTIAEPLQPEDIAENILFMVTRPRRSSIAELWAMPTSQV
jgi:NADP-dependent 3-hydroxy acid dehydrogenase YdfG